MSTLILLGLKIGITMSGFVGAVKAMEWYNTDKKGVKKSGSSNINQ